MKKGVVRKSLVLGIIMLFVGAGAIPIVNGDIITKTDPFNKNTNTADGVKDVIFSDDFNDNNKDFSKWTEIYFSGYWYEQNERTEFKMFESGNSETRYEGTESSSFLVVLTTGSQIIIKWNLTTSISSTGAVGQPVLRITDGINWIEARYVRFYDQTVYRDSNDLADTTLETSKPDGTWENEIVLYSDRYSVTMDNAESGFIYDPIFSANPILKVQIYILVGGSSPNLYTDSAFDDIFVLGPQPISISITSPEQNSWVNGITTVSGIAQSTNGTIDLVEVKIDSEQWDDAKIEGTTWTYLWNTTKFADLEHKIVGRCRDSGGAEAISSEITINVDNTGPELYLLFPIRDVVTILGRPFPMLKAPFIFGICPVYVHSTDKGEGTVVWVKYNLSCWGNDIEIKPDPVPGRPDEWVYQFSGPDTWKFGLCTLTISASDGLENENSISYRFLKIF